MIDFIRFELINTPVEEIENNKLLKFTSRYDSSLNKIIAYNTKGDEYTPAKVAHYNGLVFIITPEGRIKINGSLHKFMNDGKHNFNVFKYSDLILALDRLELEFQIKPENCLIKHIEIGVNLNTGLDNDKIIQGAIMHKSNLFITKIRNSKGYLKEANYQQYKIKLYNKSKQYQAEGYNIPDDILRFEININRMVMLQNVGIYTLLDFINADPKFLRGFLLNNWQDILLYDYTTKINPENKEMIAEYSNPNYWLNLKKDVSNRGFNYRKDKFKKITLKNSGNIQLQIKELIEEYIRKNWEVEINHCYI